MAVEWSRDSFSSFPSWSNHVQACNSRQSAPGPSGLHGFVSGQAGVFLHNTSDLDHGGVVDVQGLPPGRRQRSGGWVPDLLVVRHLCSKNREDREAYLSFCSLLCFMLICFFCFLERFLIDLGESVSGLLLSREGVRVIVVHPTLRTRPSAYKSDMIQVQVGFGLRCLLAVSREYFIHRKLPSR